jgi:hypothetical protein
MLIPLEHEAAVVQIRGNDPLLRSEEEETEREVRAEGGRARLTSGRRERRASTRGPEGGASGGERVRSGWLRVTTFLWVASGD